MFKRPDIPPPADATQVEAWRPSPDGGWRPFTGLVKTVDLEPIPGSGTIRVSVAGIQYSDDAADRRVLISHHLIRSSLMIKQCEARELARALMSVAEAIDAANLVEDDCLGEVVRED